MSGKKLVTWTETECLDANTTIKRKCYFIGEGREVGLVIEQKADKYGEVTVYELSDGMVLHR